MSRCRRYPARWPWFERRRLTGMRLSARLELAELDVRLGAAGEAAEALEMCIRDRAVDARAVP